MFNQDSDVVKPQQKLLGSHRDFLIYATITRGGGDQINLSDCGETKKLAIDSQTSKVNETLDWAMID